MNKILMDQVEPQIQFSTGDEPQKAHYTWFRGDNCNFNPTVENMRDADAALNYVLSGWLPPAPIITRNTRVVAFGSCFAASITEYLSKRQFNVLTKKEGDDANTYIVRFGEGMVNSFAIRQQFEWALEGKQPQSELWHGYDAEAFGYSEDIRRQTRDLFLSADVFIITFGLSEIWYDEPTGEVFWRAVPRDKYDSSRHKFRVSTVAENKDNIEAVVRLIRTHRPGATIIFTVSPIPLVATFRPVSCVTANSASKAILRAAIDEVVRHLRDPNLFYWPSYEIVVDVFAQRWEPDRRHIKKQIIHFIMALFENAWCVGEPPNLALLWVIARSADGTLPRRLPRLIKAGAKDDLMSAIAALTPADASLVRKVAGLD